MLPGGVSSNVKMEERPLPLYFARAQGSRLYDCDGNVYIDYTCGYGPVILGHAHPAVVAAVETAARGGFLYGGQHEGEVLLAEQLAEIVPCIDMVRYNCTGSEVVAAAVRLARAFTGRPKIIRFEGHYHGWLDEQLLNTHSPADGDTIPRLESAGQPPAAAAEILVAPWNDLSALEQVLAAHPEEVAGILMEAIMCNSGVILPLPGYLEGVRALCTRYGSVLIFDEVITGFRVHLGGAQVLCGVIPDLAVFGKALGNGFPISCVGGRRELMDLIASGGVVHAGTFNGNPLGVAAALATVTELRRDNGAAYAQLNAFGTRLMQGIREAAERVGVPVLVQGTGPVFYVWLADVPRITDYRGSAQIDRAPYARFAMALLDAGVRVIPGGRWYVTCSHSEEDVERTLDAVESALEAVR